MKVVIRTENRTKIVGVFCLVSFLVHFICIQMFMLGADATEPSAKLRQHRHPTPHTSNPDFCNKARKISDSCSEKQVQVY